MRTQCFKPCMKIRRCIARRSLQIHFSLLVDVCNLSSATVVVVAAHCHIATVGRRRLGRCTRVAEIFTFIKIFTQTSSILFSPHSNLGETPFPIATNRQYPFRSIFIIITQELRRMYVERPRDSFASGRWIFGWFKKAKIKFPISSISYVTTHAVW